MAWQICSKPASGQYFHRFQVWGKLPKSKWVQSNRRADKESPPASYLSPICNLGTARPDRVVGIMVPALCRKWLKRLTAMKSMPLGESRFQWVHEGKRFLVQSHYSPVSRGSQVASLADSRPAGGQVAWIHCGFRRNNRSSFWSPHIDFFLSAIARASGLGFV